MTESQKKNTLNAPVLNSPKKRFRLGAGTLTVVFLSLCSVLTFGFCKFSFYLLKNHRNIVERSDFSDVYVQARASHGSFDAAPDFSPDIFYDAHAPLELAKAPAPQTPSENAVRIETETLTGTAPAASVKTAFVSADRRAPFAAAPTQVAFAVKTMPDTDAAAPEKDTPLEDLISAGHGLLEENGEKLTQTATFFEEIPPAPEAATVAKAPETPVVVPAPAITAAASVNVAPAFVPAPETAAKKPVQSPAPAKTVKKGIVEGTHWVDIEALRREIEQMKEKETPKQAVAAARTYTPADQMPETRQTAALPDAPVSDGAPVVAEPEKQDAAVKETAVQKPETSEKTAENAQTASKETKPKKKKRKSPWKIAMVGGKPVGNLAVEPETAADEPAEIPVSAAADETPEKRTAAATTDEPHDSAAKAQTVIYRNGKAKQIINADGTSTDLQPQTSYREQRNTDWLDGQEAAVWTNMSQSDVPSVWSFASQEDDTPQKTKAYKVAAGEPDEAASAAQTQQPDAEANIKQETPDSTPADKTPAQQEPEQQQTQDAAQNTQQAQPTPPTPAAPAAQQPAAAPALPVLPKMPTVVQPLTNQKPSGAVQPPPAATDANLPPVFKKMGPDAAPNASADDDSFTGKLLSLFSKDAAAPSNKAQNSGDQPSFMQRFTGKTNAKTNKDVSKKDMATALKNLKNAKASDQNRILPEEIRLSFKEGNSDMAAPTVNLVKKFATHAKDDPQTYIEVRISDQMFDIQQQRFAIIRNILLSEGVEDAQILLYKSKRPPNSLVLRKAFISDEEYESHASWLNGEEERLYYKKW